MLSVNFAECHILALMLSVVMLIVVMLNVIMLSVVAPKIDQTQDESDNIKGSFTLATYAEKMAPN